MRSRKVENPRPPHASLDRAACRHRSSTPDCRSPNSQKRENEPRNLMKTKDWCSNQPKCNLALTFRSAWLETMTEKCRHEGPQYPKSAEQSENVYENKGSAQKSPLIRPHPRRGRGWLDFAAFACLATWRETGLVESKKRGTKPECL